MKILITNYTFDASAQTIVFPDYVSGSLLQEALLIITNVANGVIIYNFVDVTKGGSITGDPAGDILSLAFDTTVDMFDSDPLQIWYWDEAATQPIDDGGGSLTVDGTVTINAIPAGTNNIGDVDVVSLPALPAGTNNIGDVDVLSLPALPAGTNNIGDVDVLTLPSIPAGNNNIGDVDIASAIPAGTNLIGKVGIDQTTPGTTNGVQITNTTIAVTQSGTWDEVGINDSGNSITVDAPVGTPVFARLSDGSAALIGQKAMTASLPVVIASDQSALTVSSHAVTNAGTFAVQDSEKLADNSGFTDGATKVLPTGYIYDEVAGTALTENDIAAARINVNRAQVSTIEDGATRGRYATVSASNALKVDGSAVAQPVTDNSGSLTVDAPVGTPVFATITPSTTGGWDTFMASSADGSTALTATAQSIKGSAGTFGGYYIYNPNSSAVYVHIYDVASGSVTVGTTNPKNTFCIPATSGANLEITNGIKYGTAMSCAATTTGGGNTAPSTALEANFFYK